MYLHALHIMQGVEATYYGRCRTAFIILHYLIAMSHLRCLRLRIAMGMSINQRVNRLYIARI